MLTWFQPEYPVYGRVICDAPRVSYRLGADDKRYPVKHAGFIFPKKLPINTYTQKGCAIA